MIKKSELEINKGEFEITKRQFERSFDRFFGQNAVENTFRLHSDGKAPSELRSI